MNPLSSLSEPGMSQGPPTFIEIIALMIADLLCWSFFAGIAGALICYFGSNFATIAWAFFSDPILLSGGGFRFIAWCGSLLDRHLPAYITYICGLVFLPLMLALPFRMLGLGRISADAEARFGPTSFGRPYPGRFVVGIIAGLLFLPFVPTLVGAVAGFMVLVLFAALLALYAAVSFARYGGLRYYVTRRGERDGMRDAHSRRFR